MARVTYFDRAAGVAAFGAGVASLGYAFSLILISRSDTRLGDLLSSWFMLFGGLLVLPVLVVLYQRLREVNPELAMLGFILSLAGAIGAIMHGGYGLALAMSSFAGLSTNAASLPSQVDPRGLMSFGLSGLGWFVWASLIGAFKKFPAELSHLGYVLGGLLIMVYLSHLIGFGGDSPAVLVPSIMVGFFVYPVWFTWLGSMLQGAAGKNFLD